MNKLTKMLLVVSVLVAIVFALRQPITNYAKERITKDMFVQGDTDSFDPGVAIGDKLPVIAAQYQGETISSFDRFTGEKGLIVVANRSVVWCPYCMKQYVELSDHTSAFAEAGINIVAITYDSPADQAGFIDKHKISYPFASDIDAQSITALGILNQEYQPGDDAYGIPYPGVFVVNKDGVVTGKIFIEAYSARIEASALLQYAANSLRAR